MCTYGNMLLTSMPHGLNGMITIGFAKWHAKSHTMMASQDLLTIGGNQAVYKYAQLYVQPFYTIRLAYIFQHKYTRTMQPPLPSAHVSNRLQHMQAFIIHLPRMARPCPMGPSLQTRNLSHRRNTRVHDSAQTATTSGQARLT